MTRTTGAKHGSGFARQRPPERFCNLDRLLADMEERAPDGLVVSHGAGDVPAPAVQSGLENEEILLTEADEN